MFKFMLKSIQEYSKNRPHQPKKKKSTFIALNWLAEDLKKTRQANLHMHSFDEPVPAVASDFYSLLTGVEPKVFFLLSTVVKSFLSY